MYFLMRKVLHSSLYNIAYRLNPMIMLDYQLGKKNRSFFPLMLDTSSATSLTLTLRVFIIQ